jgi:hypothetical protein
MRHTCTIENDILRSYALTDSGNRRTILTSAAANPKTAKGAKLPLVAAIMHLAPADRSGYNTCPYASPACKYACLNTSGHGGINLVNDSNAVQETRVLKTRWLFEFGDHFLAQLREEIAALERKAKKRGLGCAVRINGTSDLGFHRMKLSDSGLSLMQTFPNVRFYDYTKVLSRIRTKLPENYHLTFSLSESNDAHALSALARGFNVAAVLRLGKYDPMPGSWSGYPVIDGTDHDFRFLDPSGGYIVGLRPKGRAITDRSGFVRDLDSTLDPARVPVLAVNEPTRNVPQFDARTTLTLSAV